MPGTSSRYRYRLVMHAWLFWGLAAVSVVTSLLVVGQRNAARGILMLTLLLAAIGGLYLLLSAPVAAILQVVVHAGGMLAIALPITRSLNLPDEIDDGVEMGSGSGARRFGVVLAVALAVELAWVFQRVSGATLPATDLLPDAGPVSIGLRVIAEYTAGVALATMLVLATALGVVLFVRREAR